MNGKQQRQMLCNLIKFKRQAQETIKNCDEMINQIYRQLEEEELYCTAGICPYKITQNDILLLMALENREGKMGLNFIGGKKNKGESPLETAARESYEETLGIISNKMVTDNTEESIWVLNHSYVIHMMPINFDPIFMFEIKKTVEPDREVDSLVWISLNELNNNNIQLTNCNGDFLNKKTQMHNFTYSIIKNNNFKKFFHTKMTPNLYLCPSNFKQQSFLSNTNLVSTSLLR